MPVVDTFEGPIDIYVKVKLRGVGLFAYSGQICDKVFMDIMVEWARCLDLVIHGCMKCKCFVDDLNNLGIGKQQ